MNITPQPYEILNQSTYRMGRLNATPEDVTRILGFEPNNAPGSDGKTTNEYTFKADDKPMSCWQYRGSAAFSIWGDLDKWAELFGADAIERD